MPPQTQMRLIAGQTGTTAPFTLSRGQRVVGLANDGIMPAKNAQAVVELPGVGRIAAISDLGPEILGRRPMGTNADFEGNPPRYQLDTFGIGVDPAGQVIAALGRGTHHVYFSGRSAVLSGFVTDETLRHAVDSASAVALFSTLDKVSRENFPPHQYGRECEQRYAAWLRQFGRPPAYVERAEKSAGCDIALLRVSAHGGLEWVRAGSGGGLYIARPRGTGYYDIMVPYVPSHEGYWDPRDSEITNRARLGFDAGIGTVKPGLVPVSDQSPWVKSAGWRHSVPHSEWEEAWRDQIPPALINHPHFRPTPVLVANPVTLPQSRTHITRRHPFSLQVGDRLIVTTQGLTSMFSAAHMAQTIHGRDDPYQMACAIIGEATRRSRLDQQFAPPLNLEYRTREDDFQDRYINSPNDFTDEMLETHWREQAELIARRVAIGAGLYMDFKGHVFADDSDSPLIANYSAGSNNLTVAVLAYNPQ